MILISDTSELDVKGRKKKTFMPLKLQNGRVTSLSIIYSWKRKNRMNVEYKTDSSM